MLHTCKDRLHRKVVFLQDGIELVIVTSGTTQRQPQESRSRGIHDVGQFILALASLSG